MKATKVLMLSKGCQRGKIEGTQLSIKLKTKAKA